jgi:hypothetical protein
VIGFTLQEVVKRNSNPGKLSFTFTGNMLLTVPNVYRKKEDGEW